MNKAGTAKVLKKTTKEHKRKRQGNISRSLASVASMANGCATRLMDSIGDDLMCTEDRKDIVAYVNLWNQLEKVVHWSDRCLDDIKIGVVGFKEANKRHRKVEKIMQKEESCSLTDKNIAVWIMISMFIDDAKAIYVKPEQRRSWNFLAGCVDTLCRYIIKESDDPDKVEEIGGEWAMKAWNIILQ